MHVNVERTKLIRCYFNVVSGREKIELSYRYKTWKYFTIILVKEGNIIFVLRNSHLHYFRAFTTSVVIEPADDACVQSRIGEYIRNYETDYAIEHNTKCQIN